MMKPKHNLGLKYSILLKNLAIISLVMTVLVMVNAETPPPEEISNCFACAEGTNTLCHEGIETRD